MTGAARRRRPLHASGTCRSELHDADATETGLGEHASVGGGRFRMGEVPGRGAGDAELRLRGGMYDASGGAEFDVSGLDTSWQLLPDLWSDGPLVWLLFLVVVLAIAVIVVLVFLAVLQSMLGGNFTPVFLIALILSVVYCACDVPDDDIGSGGFRRLSSFGGWSKPKSRKGQPEETGAVGLVNLGNTCYMNSTLQVLGHVPQFVSFFLSPGWEAAINSEAMFGTGGEVAREFAVVMRRLWSDRYLYVAPNEFKEVIGKHAKQFAGYTQQDSEEFLNRLLEFVHEDLNSRARPRGGAAAAEEIDDGGREESKDDGEQDVDAGGGGGGGGAGAARDESDGPLVEGVDHAGEPPLHPRLDRAVSVGDSSWKTHLKRNRSVVVDTIGGQIRSRLQCVGCGHTADSFEAVNSLHLQLPQVCATFRITHVPLVTYDTVEEWHLDGPVRELYVRAPVSGCVADLKRAVVAEIPLAAGTHCVFYTVSQKGRIDRQLSNSASIAHLRASNVTVQIVRDDHAPPEYRYVPIMHRRRVLVKQPKPYSYYSEEEASDDEPKMVVRRQTCGMPLLLPYRRGMSYNHLYVAASGWASYCAPEGLPDDQKPRIISTDLWGSACAGCARERRCAGCELPESDEGLTWADDDDRLDRLLQQLVIDWGTTPSNPSGESVPLPDPSWPFTPHAEVHVGRGVSQEAVAGGSALQGEDRISIADCLVKYTSEEMLDAGAWQCSGCKEKPGASKTIQLWRLPDVLIIILKRFVFDGYHHTKNNALVTFPVSGLDLSPWMGEAPTDGEAVYDLIGTSNHTGGLNGGHYTARARSPLTGKWHVYDDRAVRPIVAKDEAELQSELNVRSAYFLVYARRNARAHEQFCETVFPLLAAAGEADRAAEAVEGQRGDSTAATSQTDASDAVSSVSSTTASWTSWIPFVGWGSRTEDSDSDAEDGVQSREAGPATATDASLAEAKVGSAGGAARSSSPEGAANCRGGAGAAGARRRRTSPAPGPTDAGSDR